MRTHNGKAIAEPYEESVTEYDPSDLDEQTFMNAEVIEIDYVTQRGTIKTVRGDQPRDPGTLEPDDFELPVFGHGDEKWAYDAEEIILMTADRDRDEQAILAEEDEIREIRWIEYPSNVPVKGAPQTDVEAVIYFESKRSGNIKSKTVEVSSMDEAYGGPVRHGTSSNKLLIHGKNKADGRRIEASSAWDRTIKTIGRQDVEVGKVVRVEFPFGHEFTVQIQNLREEKREEAEKKLEEYAQEIANRYSENTGEHPVDVEHERPLEWDDV